MVAAIMPCRGRAEQTVRNVRRLLSTAGDVEWKLICVGGSDEEGTLGQLAQYCHTSVDVEHPRLTYWQAMAYASDYYPLCPLLACLANDLLPGQHWLQRAVAAYQATFGDGPGLLGFNDGHHETEHSPHFLISRSLLDDYGGWPVWYDHNYGDAELCQRAIADNVYAKAVYATLFHDHPYFGGKDDPIYAEGRAQADKDMTLFNERKARGWPAVSR